MDSREFRENSCIYLNERPPVGLHIYGVSLNEKFSFSVVRDFRVFTSSESIGGIVGIFTWGISRVSREEMDFFSLHPRNPFSFSLCLSRYEISGRPGVFFSQITDFYAGDTRSFFRNAGRHSRL